MKNKSFYHFLYRLSNIIPLLIVAIFYFLGLFLKSFFEEDKLISNAQSLERIYDNTKANKFIEFEGRVDIIKREKEFSRMMKNIIALKTNNKYYQKEIYFFSKKIAAILTMYYLYRYLYDVISCAFSYHRQNSRVVIHDKIENLWRDQKQAIRDVVGNYFNDDVMNLIGQYAYISLISKNEPRIFIKPRRPWVLAFVNWLKDVKPRVVYHMTYDNRDYALLVEDETLLFVPALPPLQHEYLS